VQSVLRSPVQVTGKAASSCGVNLTLSRDSPRANAKSFLKRSDQLEGVEACVMT
jgi:hypothetical protein